MLAEIKLPLLNEWRVEMEAGAMTLHCYFRECSQNTVSQKNWIMEQKYTIKFNNLVNDHDEDEHKI